MYQVIRNILFLFPAEAAHYISMNALKALCTIGIVRKFISGKFKIEDNLIKTACGLTFKNPIGLGAGFDKNAKYIRELEAFGFAFIEIGTVTPKPQKGNDKPRLFRLPKDKALINRMGFNNDGLDVIADRLRKWKRRQTIDNRQQKNSHFTSYISRLIIGGNIGKNKETPNGDAWKDYEKCFQVLHPYVDFFVVNVSSPNTPGLRELQEKNSLKKILNHLQVLNQNHEIQRPIFLKIAPDLSLEQIDDVIDLAIEIKLDGLVATNTTISRGNLSTSVKELQEIGAGGLSGKPLKRRSTEIIRYIFKRTNGKILIIGSGGIFNSEDANEKLNTGATLLEVWTGFIYEGPGIVKSICKQLKKR
jgi:dihydroorotate dehydrogenase